MITCTFGPALSSWRRPHFSGLLRSRSVIPAAQNWGDLLAFLTFCTNPALGCGLRLFESVYEGDRGFISGFGTFEPVIEGLLGNPGQSAGGLSVIAVCYCGEELLDGL
jgi:hypothetical protein